MSFIFKDFGILTNGVIDLVLVERSPAEPERKYVPRYKFNITIHNCDEIIGEADIRIGHNRNTYFGGNVGYCIDPKYRGHGYAAQAVRLLKKVAKTHKMSYIHGSCNPNNTPSRKTLENAGFELKGIENLPEDNDLYHDGERQACIYKLMLL